MRRALSGLPARGDDRRPARRLGAVRRSRRRRSPRPARPPRGRRLAVRSIARCCGATSWSPPRRSCSGSSSRRRRRWAWPSLIHFSPTLRRALYPLLVASQAIPVPMLAPVLALWLGFGIGPKLVVIALVSFFPIVVTTLAGLSRRRPGPDQADAHLRRLARGRPSAASSCRPRCPAVFTGAKIADRGRGDRGRVRRTGRLERRPRLPVRRSRSPQLLTAAGVRHRRRSCRCSSIGLFAC